MQREALLENLALPAGGFAEFSRAEPGGAVEGTDEIGEIGETDIIGDVGQRSVIVGEKPRRMPQPRAHQILVRGDPEHAGKQPQEMERAEFRLRRGVLQVDVLMRMASIQSAVSTARRRWRALAGGGACDRPETTSTKRVANSVPTS